MKIFTTFILAVMMVFPSYSQTVNPLNDVRMCGFVPRTASGDIKRRSDVLTAFQRLHPCPSTGLTTGACPAWAKDHVIPLACGGCDAVYNLAWVPHLAKSCKDNWCKDRYERKINAANPPVPDSSRCVNTIVTEEDLKSPVNLQ